VLGGLLIASLLIAPETEATPDRYELAWAAPQECPKIDEVRARVDELLAHAPAAVGEPIVADVRVTAGPSGFVAHLQLRSGETEGRRELGDPDCRELGEAVALIVALAVDPELMSREVEPIDEPVEEPDEQPDEEDPDEEDPEPTVEITDPPPPARPPALRGFGLALRGGAEFAAVAPASGRASLSASSFGRQWRAELGVAVGIPQRIDIGRFSTAAAELRGCWVPEVQAVEFPLCAGIEAGAIIGVGRVDAGRRATAPWLVATPGVGVSWVVLEERLALGLRVDAVLPLLRPAFTSDEGRLLVRVGFGAQVLGGVEVRFGRRRGDRAP
jgi:hypothetical protein